MYKIRIFGSKRIQKCVGQVQEISRKQNPFWELLFMPTFIVNNAILNGKTVATCTPCVVIFFSHTGPLSSLDTEREVI